MKTFQQQPVQELQKISDIIGDTVLVDGRPCAVRNKRQVPREGWGAVLRFDVYDSQIERHYDLFADNIEDDLIGGVVRVWQWSENYSTRLFDKEMLMQYGYENEVRLPVSE